MLTSATCNGTAPGMASAVGFTARNPTRWTGRISSIADGRTGNKFRFIVAAEDGKQLADLRSFTRDLMRQTEGDLGTRLDWIAVDHSTPVNPHSHVIIRAVTSCVRT
jgi:hypothetical protein